jgi:RNase P/RNase MRP subunit p30
MQMTSLIDLLIGIIIIGGGWWLNRMATEQKRLEILLNKTREDYATKHDLREDMRNVMEALNRLDAKLDKLMGRD